MLLTYHSGFWMFLGGCHSGGIFHDLESVSHRNWKKNRLNSKKNSHSSETQSWWPLILNTGRGQGGWSGERKLDVGRILDEMELMSRHMLADCQKSQWKYIFGFKRVTFYQVCVCVYMLQVFCWNIWLAGNTIVLSIWRASWSSSSSSLSSSS